MGRLESGTYFPHETSLPKHTLESVTDSSKGLTVKFFDTLPFNGHHNGTIISAPGLGAHPESKDTYQMRHLLNMKDFGAVDWYEAPWGNRLAPLGRDSGLENTRGLKCQEIILKEVEQRNRNRGAPDEIHLVGWSRGAGLAAAGAGEHASRISTLTLVCPGFMKDTSWVAAKRYLSGRAADALHGIRQKGVTHLREFVPFLKAAFANPHRMIHRGGAAAGFSPIRELFIASLEGLPTQIYQGSHDETFPPDIVRNNIERGFRELYDALLANEGSTVFEENRTLEELMPKFILVRGGHGIGTPDEAAELLTDGIHNMNQRREGIRGEMPIQPVR